jgi:hypothetical protein
MITIEPSVLPLPLLYAFDMEFSSQFLPEVTVSFSPRSSHETIQICGRSSRIGRTSSTLRAASSSGVRGLSSSSAIGDQQCVVEKLNLELGLDVSGRGRSNAASFSHQASTPHEATTRARGVATFHRFREPGCSHLDAAEAKVLQNS